MRVQWKTDRSGQLIADYFPYHDGHTGSFRFDATKMAFELEVTRHDLGEICVFRFLDVRHYGLSLKNIDIVGRAFLWPLADSPRPVRDDKDDPWALIFPHDHGSKLDEAAERETNRSADAWLIAIYCNMDGRLAMICRDMELELRTIPE